jgi:folate-dependent phosphoribosylglycinamide formyltransferase PurN
MEDDDANSLANRVFESEKEALPDALQLFADRRLRIVEGRRVLVVPAVHGAVINDMV